MVPNIVFAPNICRTQNTDTGRKTQTQLITGLIFGSYLSLCLLQSILNTHELAGTVINETEGEMSYPVGHFKGP